MRYLCISFLLLCCGAAVSATDLCATTPPTLWCESAELAKQCGWSSACDNYAKAVHNKPVLITLLYEALCPGCQKFIVEQLYPRVFKSFPASVVEIELVPYGNAKIKGGQIVCQHGEEECRINKFESCLIDSYANNASDYFPVIYCLENQLKAGIDFQKATNKCFRTLGVGEDIQRLVQSCLVSKLSTQLQMAAAERTDNIAPEKHDHVPWVLFNNVSIGSAQLLLEYLPTSICQWYKGDVSVPACEVDKAKMQARVGKCWKGFRLAMLKKYFENKY